MSDSRHDRLVERAHQLWLAEGQPDGQAGRHWHEAEQQIDAEDELGAAAPPAAEPVAAEPAPVVHPAEALPVHDDDEPSTQSRPVSTSPM